VRCNAHAFSQNKGVLNDKRDRYNSKMTTELRMQNLSEIYTRLYIAFLKSVIYDDVAFEMGSNIPANLEDSDNTEHKQENATELTLGTIVDEHRETLRRRHENSEAECADSAGSVDSSNAHDSCFLREDELLVYGMPKRRQASL
jgi:hypothetical protein